MSNREILQGEVTGRFNEEMKNDQGGSIEPGQLLEVTNTSPGSYTEGGVQLHSTAGGNAQPRVALNKQHRRAVDPNDSETSYSSSDQVRTRVLGKGEKFLGRVDGGENLSPGDRVQSAGNGNFQAFSAQADDGGGDDITQEGVVAVMRESFNDASAGLALMEAK